MLVKGEGHLLVIRKENLVELYAFGFYGIFNLLDDCVCACACVTKREHFL